MSADLWAARQQMALSLGWHIILASLGVGFPVLVGFAEWRALRTADPIYRLLARRWAKALAVLFAIGAVSGTILSFELGILWPGLMSTFGEVIGLPFAIEAFAFFLEAVFLGIYLYGWGRLPQRWHAATLIPVAIGGAASAWFVVTANAWMNQPAGFDVEHYLSTGEVTGVDPWAAMLNPATPPQTVHMLLAAYILTGFAVAAVYAWGLLRGRGGVYHRRGFVVAFAFAAALTLPQIVVGDWAARFLADYQPIKFAALEALYNSEAEAPLRIGGFPVDGEVRYAIEIPGGLSWLAEGDTDAIVTGLAEFPRDQWPPVAVVRSAFQLMVAIGFFLLGLALWFAWSWWRRRDIPASKWFLRAAVLAGFAAPAAVEAGWVVTEVGRQPWIVYGLMRVDEAVTRAPNVRLGYYALIVVYTVLTAASLYVLRRLAAQPLGGGQTSENANEGASP
ncbi:MAG: cytochrome ubiquinol oxidase subunit I [Nitriliruptorales bacterium]